MTYRRFKRKSRKKPYSRKRRRFSKKKRYKRKRRTHIKDTKYKSVALTQYPYGMKCKKTMPLQLSPTVLYPFAGSMLNPPSRRSMCFSCNDLFQPVVDGNNVRIPQHSEIYMDHFNHCTGIGFKVHCRLFNPNEYPVRLTMDLRASPTKDRLAFQKDVDLISGTCKELMIPPSKTGVLQYSVNPNKFLSISKPLTEDRIKHTMKTHPEEQVYVTTYVTPWFDNGSNVDPEGVLPCQCEFSLEYTAVFSEPKGVLRISTWNHPDLRDLEHIVTNDDVPEPTPPADDHDEDHTHTYEDDMNGPDETSTQNPVTTP